MIALLAAAALACPPLPGVEQLYADPKVRTVIFGEVHGTAEAPALFGDAVCHAAARGPVTVALEQSGAAVALMEAYVATGDAAARRRIVESPEWNGRIHDGRTSAAMLQLVDRLRALRARGADIKLVGVMPAAATASQDYHEVLMAAGWAGAVQRPPRLLLGLVGNLHARKTPVPLGGRRLTPAAALLPAGETLTVDIVGGGGSTWSCTTLTDCGPHASPAEPAPPRGVSLQPTDDGAYDGTASIGGPTTASPPAASGS